ncbi:MAG: hypothetical protein ACI81V_001126 [Lentimonas sp.]|jgi:uncharacterized protein (DUF1800 family)
MHESPPTPDTLAVKDAWKPLPSKYWRREEAAHFLRRIGFSATPEAVEKVLRGSIQKTIDEFFTVKTHFEKPAALAEFEEEAPQRYQAIYRDTKDRQEKRRLMNDLRRENNELFHDFAMQWFRYAREPENSAREKFVLFLQDVFVVEQQIIKETPLLFNMQQALRKAMSLSYPELCKQVSREPAMVRYLNFNENTA